MRVLITGGGGFIGSHVIDHLLASGAEIVALRRPHSHGRTLGDEQRLTWRECGLNDVDTLHAIFQEFRPEACLHIAWYTETGKYAQSHLNLDLLQASLALVRIAGEEGCKRFVGVGTCAEYELATKRLAESDPTVPGTLYGAAKLSLRHLGATLSQSFGMQFAWGRIFYVYGPREDKRRVVPAVINTILDGGQFDATTGEQVRDFLHVGDVARAFTILCTHTAEGVFNVCAGQPTTLRSLLTTIATEMGQVDKVRFGAADKHAFDPPYIVGDNSRLRFLGWQPQHTLRSGLLDTIHWWEGYRKIAPTHR